MDAPSPLAAEGLPELRDVASVTAHPKFDLQSLLAHRATAVRADYRDFTATQTFFRGKPTLIFPGPVQSAVRKGKKEGAS